MLIFLYLLIFVLCNRIFKEFQKLHMKNQHCLYNFNHLPQCSYYSERQNNKLKFKIDICISALFFKFKFWVIGLAKKIFRWFFKMGGLEPKYSFK